MGKKLEKFVKQSEVQLQSLNCSTQQLRANCYGQDRYWRRYWSLPKAGGIYIESMESADPEVFHECEREDQAMEVVSEIVDEVKDIKQEDVIDISENVKSESDTLTENGAVNDNEHRKTPNRLDVVENGDIGDQCERERSLDELRKSVDKIVQSLDSNVDLNQGNETESQDISIKLELNHTNKDELQLNHVDEVKLKIEPSENQVFTKKLNIFEKLGECMERENRTEDDLKTEIKAEVKEELKNEILNELKVDFKSEIKAELLKTEIDDDKIDSETKWFSILSRESLSCEGTHLAQGNKWENGVGLCSRENITELKIPVFPPPNSSSCYFACDSPGPLQMTPEEGVQLEYIKIHGMPNGCERKPIPLDKRYSWWRIFDTEQLKTVLENLHVRGARERELKRTFLSTMQSMYERQGKVFIEEGQKDATDLTLTVCDDVEMGVDDVPKPDTPGTWSTTVAHRVDTFLFEQVSLVSLFYFLNLTRQVKSI